MLIQANMGGMDEMNGFYTKCLESLYPPGSCGAVCTNHNFEWCAQSLTSRPCVWCRPCIEYLSGVCSFLEEVENACCDEGGLNCDSSSVVPR